MTDETQLDDLPQPEYEGTVSVDADTEFELSGEIELDAAVVEAAEGAAKAALE